MRLLFFLIYQKIAYFNRINEYCNSHHEIFSLLQTKFPTLTKRKQKIKNKQFKLVFVIVYMILEPIQL